jgi:hypothetical protein
VTNAANNELNKLGSDILTITGTGFPHEKNPVVNIEHDNTVCKIISSSLNEIKCRIERFDQFKLNDIPAQGIRVVVVVNDKTEIYQTTFVLA